MCLHTTLGPVTKLHDLGQIFSTLTISWSLLLACVKVALRLMGLKWLLSLTMI